MNKIYKTFRGEVKSIDADEGMLDLFIPVSTSSIDRDGEIIEPTAFKKTLPKFMKHPVLVSSHDYRDLTKQIGEWAKLKITEDGIEGKPKYYVNEGNEEADWAFNLASKGRAAFSIGFIPKEWEDGDGQKAPRRTYKEVELLEISQVIIPSNREAIQNIRSKSVDPVITEICDEVEKDLPENEPELIEDKEIITKPEETNDFIRIPVRTCEVTATIDISKKEGISALYCGKEKQVRTYLFRKDKGWDMTKAKAWVKEHDGKSYEPHETSQSEIIDEIDYLKSLIEKEGLSEEAKESANELLKVMCTPELLKQMDMADMKKMMTMMADCEKMAGKAKEMAQGMMDDMKSVNPGNDIPVEKKDIDKTEDKKEEPQTSEEILGEIKNINLGG